MSAQIGHSGGIETVVLALERLIISAATRAPVEWSNDADWPANLATEMPVAC